MTKTDKDSRFEAIMTRGKGADISDEEADFVVRHFNAPASAELRRGWAARNPSVARQVEALRKQGYGKGS